MGTTKSVGFARSAEERDSISGPSVHNEQLKELDAAALAGDAKAEDYKYDPDEKGETWDIYKQRSTIENEAKRKSEDAVLIKAKADAAIRAAQVASACGEATQGFLDQASVGRRTRGRTAIVAVESVEIPEERQEKTDGDESEEEQSGSEGTDPGEWTSTTVHKSIKMFHQHDEDGNGELDKEEFVNLLPHLGIRNISRDEAEDLFTDIDADGSGYLDVTEFGLWFTKFTAAEKAFKITDTDGGGTIDPAEFKVLVQRLGIAEGDFWIETESNKLFKEIDTDSSGSIDMKEFVMWYSVSPLTDVSPLERKLRTKTAEGFDTESDEDEDKENEVDEAQAAYKRKTAAIKAAEKAAAHEANAGKGTVHEKAVVEQTAAEKNTAEKAPAAAAAPAEAPAANTSSRSSSQTGNIYSVEDLQNGVPAGVDPTRKEDYLSDADFEVLLKMGRDAFAKMPAWKKQAAKKNAKIF